MHFSSSRRRSQFIAINPTGDQYNKKLNSSSSSSSRCMDHEGWWWSSWDRRNHNRCYFCTVILSTHFQLNPILLGMLACLLFTYQSLILKKKIGLFCVLFSWAEQRLHDWNFCKLAHETPKNKSMHEPISSSNFVLANLSQSLHEPISSNSFFFANLSPSLHEPISSNSFSFWAHHSTSLHEPISSNSFSILANLSSSLHEPISSNSFSFLANLSQISAWTHLLQQFLFFGKGYL